MAYRANSDPLKKVDDLMEAKHIFGITGEIWNTAEEMMKVSKGFPKSLALLEEETHSASTKIISFGLDPG